MPKTVHYEHMSDSMAARDPLTALATKDSKATKLLHKVLADSALTEKTPAQKAAATRAANKAEISQRKAKDKFWLDATKILVPAYWGNNGVAAGFKLAQKLSPAGVLALILVGMRNDEGPAEAGNPGSCEVSMQIKAPNVRPGGGKSNGKARFCRLKSTGLFEIVSRGRAEFWICLLSVVRQGRKGIQHYSSFCNRCR